MKKLIIALLLSLPTFCIAGRYEFHMHPQYPAQSVMIDTQTGKLWKQTCYTTPVDGECKVKAWSPESVVGVNVDEKAVWKMAEEVNGKGVAP